ncbi:MAG: proteasome assembly chaperone family protein [Haloferacaceae archaeon]
MAKNDTWFEGRNELALESPTLVEGFPGLGMVASIATDRITEQLGLDGYGVIRSDDLPPVTTFENGRVHDLVRVNAGAEPSVMTLQSDLPIPPTAFDSLAQCILDDLTDVFDRAVFLAGVPAENEDQRGDIFGVATTESVESELQDAGIELADGPGLLGGVTGALVSECYHADVPAAVLVVRATPYLPDPGAARTLIEEALEPLVHFDVDTSELVEQADRIRQQKQQIAQQLKQQQQTGGQQPPSPSMYQ